ncbi:MAG: sulfotransferase domain-containing protein [Vicinamibacterales bacterium]
MSWLAIAAIVAALLAANVVYLVWYFGWVERQTAGAAYFSRPVDERRALKRRIRLLSIPTLPLMRLLASGSRSQKGLPGFEYEGVWGPQKVATPEVFAKARAYVPGPDDVFVATQMRCGTTWMQQIVHQVVTHGRGTFEPGSVRSHIYTISPWIDATHGVSMEAAPLVGQPPVRIIKTHLPVELCPYSPSAKYIYVARHPVSCFASIVDFNRTMIGPLLPPVAALADWFCSDRMYWLPWARHVEGYWKWAARHDNVLFVHYEDMVRDFGPVLDRITTFLGHSLTPEERAQVIERTSFRYMKEHEEAFEMAPPSMFSVAAGQFLASGRERRHEDVTPEIKARIVDYCRKELAGAEYPAARFYPDLA